MSREFMPTSMRRERETRRGAGRSHA